jgi:hypothetical protein
MSSGRIYSYNNIYLDIYFLGGGAIFNAKSVDAFLTNCLFKNITSTLHSGCIYFESSTVSIIKCCFIHCATTNKKDNVWSNAF